MASLRPEHDQRGIVVLSCRKKPCLTTSTVEGEQPGARCGGRFQSQCWEAERAHLCRFRISLVDQPAINSETLVCKSSPISVPKNLLVVDRMDLWGIVLRVSLR